MQPTSLRIFGLETADTDIVLSLHGLFHRGDGFRLVVLNTDHAYRALEKLEQDLHTFHDLVCFGTHHLIIAGQIWFTLGTIHNNVLDGVRILR